MAEMSNQDMAQLFQVSVRVIYSDITKIRRAKVKEVETEDIAFLVGDLKMAFEKTLRDLEFSQRKAVPGTKTYLDHCKAIFDLRERLIHLYQDIGLIPKDLNKTTYNTYNLIANVAQDTGREVRALDLPEAGYEVIEMKELAPALLEVPNGTTTNSNFKSVPAPGSSQES